MVIELRIYSRLIRVIKVRKQELNQKWFPSSMELVGHPSSMPSCCGSGLAGVS